MAISKRKLHQLIIEEFILHMMAEDFKPKKKKKKKSKAKKISSSKDQNVLIL